MSFIIDKEYYRRIVYDIATRSEPFREIVAERKRQERENYKKRYKEITSENYLKSHRGVEGFAPGSKVKSKRGYLVKISRAIYIKSLYYCPIDTGKLKASATFTDNTDYGFCRITYGSNDIGYAIYVHELLDREHIAPTQAKFLEDAALDIINENKGFWIKNNIPVRIGISFKNNSIQMYIDDGSINMSDVSLYYDNTSIVEIEEDLETDSEEYNSIDDNNLDEAAYMLQMLQSGNIDYNSIVSDDEYDSEFDYIEDEDDSEYDYDEEY